MKGDFEAKYLPIVAEGASVVKLEDPVEHSFGLQPRMGDFFLLLILQFLRSFSHRMCSLL